MIWNQKTSLFVLLCHSELALMFSGKKWPLEGCWWPKFWAILWHTVPLPEPCLRRSGTATRAADCSLRGAPGTLFLLCLLLTPSTGLGTCREPCAQDLIPGLQGPAVDTTLTTPMSFKHYGSYNNVSSERRDLEIFSGTECKPLPYSFLCKRYGMKD